ncbi:MAG: tRNA (adenosine(37)-N6)-threonylcarbamoyltransferase complex ATPase subunit type 1 TsaE [Deltaproteobacteria bacterium RBG_13_58_19]|nr:MAG: tRNA (adenosine(37)-N6)-threonylcarbamoyltransferase complex ATPase subunit type 1 TsaE [Deltaproteobacteria bacterium RBG_13_58_19]
MSRSPAQTRTLAARLGEELAPGDVVALQGELGSGKTEFVKGLAQGLGVAPEVPVTSPSFVLVHEYPGRLKLMHLDLYRLEKLPPELLPDLEEYLFGPQVTAIEWAERLDKLLPENHLEVQLTITGETQREITLTGHGPRGRRLLEVLVEGDI